MANDLTSMAQNCVPNYNAAKQPPKTQLGKRLCSSLHAGYHAGQRGPYTWGYDHGRIVILYVIFTAEV